MYGEKQLFLGLMRMRGMEARTRYAEGFFASKDLHDLATTALDTIREETRA